MIEVLYGRNIGTIWVQPSIQHDISELWRLITDLESEYYKYITHNTEGIIVTAMLRNA